MFTRYAHNPIVAPEYVKPSRPDFEVIGTFNAGATIFQDQVILLVRVAERPAQSDPGWLLFPYMGNDGQIQVERIARSATPYDLSDPRTIRDPRTGDTYLTSISHIRLARSIDGFHFEVDDSPWLCAQPPYENFGVEDARVTKLDDVYYVNYSAVSPLGISTALISTHDFVNIERHGVIFPPSNRDVVIFPAKIGDQDQYVCYHRPMPSPFGGLHMWSATSPDLIHWGNHRLVLQAESGGWEAGRVGGGAPPLATDQGWLSIYHAADHGQRYCLGAFLTPHDVPAQIIRRSRQPVLSPEANYETQGFFENVVFTCGALLRGEQLYLYYGAADRVIAVAEAPLAAVLEALTYGRFHQD